MGRWSNSMPSGLSSLICVCPVNTCWDVRCRDKKRQVWWTLWKILCIALIDCHYFWEKSATKFNLLRANLNLPVWFLTGSTICRISHHSPLCIMFLGHFVAGTLFATHPQKLEGKTDPRLRSAFGVLLCYIRSPVMHLCTKIPTAAERDYFTFTLSLTIKKVQAWPKQTKKNRG